MSGKRVVIITNAGGVGAIAADAAERSGLEVSPLGDTTERLMRSKFGNASFVSTGSLRNPIDLTASATTEEFTGVVDFVLNSRDYDLALVLPTHQTPAMDHDVASRVSEVVLSSKEPTAMCVMGNSALAAAIHSDFMARGIPSFPTPERAVGALSVLPAYEDLRRTAGVTGGGQGALRLRSGGPRGARGNRINRILHQCGIDQPRSTSIHSFG